MTNDRRPQRGFSRREFIQTAAAAGGTMFRRPRSRSTRPRSHRPPTRTPT